MMRAGPAVAGTRKAGALMLRLELHCFDFMDRVPVERAVLRVTLQVVPNYWHPAGTDPDQLHPHATITPEWELVESFVAQAVTDSAGFAAVEFHPAEAWERVSNLLLDGALPRTVTGDVRVSGEVPWLDLHPAVRPLELREPGGTHQLRAIVDPAKVIVGYTTATSTRLWFQLHGAPRPGFRLVAEIASGNGTPQRQDLTFLPDPLRTAVLPLDGLQPSTLYHVQLSALEAATGSQTVLARGQVQTPSRSPTSWTIAFTSCHRPSNLPSLVPWVRRAAAPSADLMLMLGDQIYDSGMPTSSTDRVGWFARYLQRYNALWAYQPLRDVLRRTPTCMMFDDHEFADDWGVVSNEDLGFERWRAALDAYRRFQDPLNPPSRVVPVPAAWDYGWRAGPLAFYMFDERNHRGRDADANVLGSEQLERFRTWAASTDTRLADVIVIGSSVPLAFLPIQRLLAFANTASVGAGAAAGAIIGAWAGGPVGAFIGALIGASGVGLAEDAYVGSLREPDYHDQWTYRTNQPNLAALLDILFDLANDITNGARGPRARAVIVLSGDVHVGGCYLLRSARQDDGHDHRRNNLMFQFVSSPSSAPLPTSGTLKELMEQPGRDIDLRRANFLSDDPDVETGSALDVRRFVLDSEDRRFYAAEFLGSVLDYNFGTLTIERNGPRTYRFSAAVEGTHDSLTTLFELNLDAPVVRPRDLIGERLSITGTPVLLRVHESGSGYGPPSDRLDADVVVQLDTAPGRSFGFTLRNGPTLRAHRGLLTLLRAAFNDNRPVTIEYDRTGPRNGRIVRVIQR
jgi:hypothetical protein